MIGSSRFRTASQPGRPVTGNSAPEMKNIGITTICVTPMNDCICLMRTATITPNAVIANASSSIIPKMPRTNGTL